MLSIAEFNEAVSGHQKRIAVGLLGASGAAMAGFAAVGLFQRPLRAFYESQAGEAAGDALLALTFLPSLLVLFAGIWVADRWAKGDPRLRCPSCGKALADLRRLVTATRNCGYCGKRILSEPEPLD